MRKGTTKLCKHVQLYTSRIPPAPLLQLEPWRYHTSFLRSSIEAQALDVVPTVHAHETHSYRFVVLQVLLVALHAQFCQPSSN